MTILGCMCQSPDLTRDLEYSTDPFERDYDNNPTSLYQAMESKAWLPTLEFFDTGKWSNAESLFSSGEDPISPELQARTWITRFEVDGSVRWSQLPLHAALVFGAPLKIVGTLVALYPPSVRCTDDQHMLPLHLAIKFGAEDKVVRFLLEKFPDSLFTKDIRGRLPSEIKGPRNDRTKILEETLMVTTKTLRKKHLLNLQDELAELKEGLEMQNKLNFDMEQQKKQVELEYEQAQSEVAMMKNTLRSLQKALQRQTAEVRTRADQISVQSDIRRTTSTGSRKSKKMRTLVHGRKRECEAQFGNEHAMQYTTPFEEDVFLSKFRETPDPLHLRTSRGLRETTDSVNLRKRGGILDATDSIDLRKGGSFRTTTDSIDLRKRAILRETKDSINLRKTMRLRCV